MKINKINLFILPIVIILSMMVMINITYAQTWKFAVISDTHDADKDNTATGVTAYLSPIIKFIIEEKPDMVLETGDLITGTLTKPTSPVYTKYEDQYAAFQKLVEPLNKANIPLFVIRGNHDYGKKNGDLDIQQAYQAAFAHNMPQNGPEDEKGLSYSFVHKKIKFIMVDQYINASYDNITLPLDWLEKELENKQNAEHVFVFGHSPAYSPADEKRRHFNLYDQPDLRDQFWGMLVKNNVTAYICGHKHIYFRGNVNGVEQICAGNLGDAMGYNSDKVDNNLADVFPEKSVAVTDNRPGYIIFTVDTNKNTITANEYCLDANSNKYLYDTYQFNF